MKRITVVMFCIAVINLLAACGSDANQGGKENPEVKMGGYIVDKENSSILVTDAESKNAFWFSNVNTDLSIGTEVEVTYSGPVMESYPAQASGLRIEVIHDHKDESTAIAEALETVSDSQVWMVQSVSVVNNSYLVELKNTEEQVISKTIDLK